MAFERISMPNLLEMLPTVGKPKTVLEARTKNGKLRSDFAGASGSRVGPLRKQHKTARKRYLRAITLRILFFYRAC